MSDERAPDRAPDLFAGSDLDRVFDDDSTRQGPALSTSGRGAG